MKITVLWVGKTSEDWLQRGVAEYEGRIRHYLPYSSESIIVKNLPRQDIDRQKELEGDALLARMAPTDEVFLLCERGQPYTSAGLAALLQKKMSASVKNLVLAIGGPFGFADKVYQRANGVVSFSQLTFSHQMIRLLLCEQLYRALTIIRGESYHHA